MTITEALSEAPLSQRVDDLIESHHRTPILSTTGTHAAVQELLARNRRLELALRELSAEVERLGVLVEEALNA